MTMSAKLVNTSNWDHEDLSVAVDEQEPVVLKPGETLDISIGHGSPDPVISIKDIHDEDLIEPFRINGKGQAIPEVTVGFRNL